MPLKRLIPLAVLVVLCVAPAVCQPPTEELAQNSSNSPASRANKPTDAEPPPASPSTGPYTVTGPTDFPPPRISTVNPPPAAPTGWPLQDRIKWLTEVLLVVIAYVGAWLAFSTLRKIEQQTRYSEEAAQAAADAAKAALTFAESQARSERPWLLVTAAPVPGGTNSFSVTATNRGRSPARVSTLAECIAIVRDEAELPPTPIYKTPPRAPATPTVLLPGESMSIKTFSRDEVKSVCETPEEAQSIEDWQEKIYIYGSVIYGDLTSTSEPKYETGWCCWYIHGRQKSGMIMAGPPDYNKHT